MTDLKLLALDAEDLEILSAHLQDAVLKAGDIHWRADEKRLVLALNRFVWESAGEKSRRAFERRRSALRFDRVTRVRAHRIPRDRPDTVLELLALRFTETDAPSGVVEAIFAGGGVLRIEVECLEAGLCDLGAAWATESCPKHEEA
ncbi:DUF2948 family protein [Pinisolibacter sp.]|uniref:DUF2948 family protein n=1 Tax=Pinisolibacter sp. TaxID=2172024 RepID=UPI002FDCCB7B